jgi:SAM-dependent methyltransferase
VSERGAVALYDSLARFQWWRRTWSRAALAEGLELRKRLNPPLGDGPSNGCAGLDQWLMQRVAERPRQRLLDLGCGFGASLLRWMPASEPGEPVQAFGITPSRYQVRRARQVVARLGVGERISFSCQALEATLPADLHMVLAIEALGHTADLPMVLGNIRRSLQPGGVLVWLEDLLNESAAEDTDVAGLARCWSSPPLRDVASVRRELAVAGLHVIEEIDLTPQVPRRELAQIHRSYDAAHKWQRWAPVPFARRIASAFAGGFLLERLYARELACYRLFMAEAREVSDAS